MGHIPEQLTLFQGRDANVVRLADDCERELVMMSWGFVFLQLGKAFTLRRTFPDKKDDYVVVINGLVAGRLLKSTRSLQRVAWFWTITAPYYSIKMLQHGEEETFEAAREAFKKLFWEWNAWAVK